MNLAKLIIDFRLNRFSLQTNIKIFLIWNFNLIIYFLIFKAKKQAVKKESDQDNLMIRQLGELALKYLNEGEPVKDEIIVHILVEKIRTLSQDKGFIIDGFPATFDQARLLEKALTGYDEENQAQLKAKRESVLAPNPRPEPPKPKHKSGIDLIIYCDLPDDLVLKRSVGRYCKF